MTAKNTPISTVGVIDQSAFTHQLSIAGSVARVHGSTLGADRGVTLIGQTHRAPLSRGPVFAVDLSGIEPLTSSLRTKRSTN